MTILEMAPYINGDVFTRECASPVRCTPEMFNRVVNEARASKTFARTIELLEDYRDFMEVEPDIAYMFPTSEREEMFYCLKNNGYSPNVPAKCIYLLKHLYGINHSASLALKALNKNTLQIFFQKGYLDGVTIRDVIKTFCDPEYEPFTPARLRVAHKDYDEVYIMSEDMVALLPKDVSAKLSDTDLPNIVYTPQGLKVGSLYLRFLANHFGACNSIYDLRELV